MKHIFKILALSFFATTSIAANAQSDRDDDDHKKRSLTLVFLTKNDGDIVLYGDATQLTITNSLTNAVLAETKSLNALKHLNLSNMNLIGDFPKEIGLLPHLARLDLNDNALTSFDGSMFENFENVPRVVTLSLFNNPLKTFSGPKDNVTFRLCYSRSAVSIHFDPTVFKTNDFSPLRHLVKTNIQSNETEFIGDLYCIKCSFYESIPIPQTLTEKFGITHEGNYYFMSYDASTKIIRQWSIDKKTCDISADHLAKGYDAPPLVQALKAALFTGDEQ